MSAYIFIEGILIGFVVAVPVGPLGLLCINRALMLGPVTGLFSGLGVATADALAAGIAALGIYFISDFLSDHQIILRLLGGIFLVYLGLNIYRSKPKPQLTPSNVNGLLAAYATTLFLTFSNPVTILSFIAIYAGWHVESMSGRYVSAAILASGVFVGSALWWLALFLGLTAFRERFNLHILAWVHRVSGVIITGFGLLVLLSLSPLRGMLDRIIQG
jgi:threonine/homoserine/homoserine lactone efflux protein